MKNRLILLITLVVVTVLLFCGAVSVWAVGETVPTDNPPVTDPVYTTGDATFYPTATQGTGSLTDPGTSTDPTETGTTSTDPTETTVPDNTRGTEFVSSPTNSPYWATEGQFNASQYEGTAAPWNDIDADEVISLKNDTLDGVMSFEEIKSDRTKGDKTDWTFYWIAIALLAVSVAAIIVFIATFAMTGNKAAVPAKGKNITDEQRRNERERARRRRDDYHDGY